MTPAMVISGLYGNYSTLENYIAHYKDQIIINVHLMPKNIRKRY